MKKTNVIVLFVVLLLGCKDKKEVIQTHSIGDFTFSSRQITQNQPFTITYTGKEELKESFYNQLHKTKSYPKDLEFKDNTATISIPDSITAVVFNFKIGDSYENNDKKGYLFTVKDRDGYAIADSEASLKYYTMIYGEDYGIASDEKETLRAIESALRNNEALDYDWISTHVYVAQQVESKKGELLSNKYIERLTTKDEMSYKDYKALSSVYYTIRNTTKGDSIISIAAEKFPDSDLAVRPIMNAFFEAKTIADKETIFNANKEKLLNSPNANYILRSLAFLHHKENNKNAFNTYIGMLKSNTSKASLYNSIAWPKAEKGEDLESVAQLSKESLKLIEAEQQNLDEKPDYLSLNQYKKSLIDSYNMYADTYALLLFKQGLVKDAITYQEKAHDPEGKDAEANTRYISYLMADSQYDKVLDKATFFIENGGSTNELKEFYKSAYEQTNSDGNADEILADLEAKAKQKEREKLRKTLLNEDAPDFTLKNLEGEEVTLSSLKGKTVVLDFWATWCGPCIASFPGMQNVVTKYKDNDDVVFFFVDTFEDGENRLKEVKDFIEKNDYSFNVLIDPTEENGSQHVVAKKYKISGIPTKIIIGPSGKINFKSVGFGGSAQKTVDEIDAMVELLKTTP